MKLYAISLILLIWAEAVNAQPRTLIISGGGSPDSNLPEFENIVNLAYRTELARKHDPVVLSSDGSLTLFDRKSTQFLSLPTKR